MSRVQRLENCEGSKHADPGRKAFLAEGRAMPGKELLDLKNSTTAYHQ